MYHADMNVIQQIRARLKLSQGVLAPAIGVSPSLLSHYERGKCNIPPEAAGRLIRVARTHGLLVSYDHIYGEKDLPPEPAKADPAASEGAK